MAKNNLRIAICQMEVKDDKKANIKKAEDMIDRASVKHPDIIVLPEMFNCPYEIKLFKKYSEPYGAETTLMLSSMSKKTSSIIIGGSIPEKDGNRIYNSCFVFGSGGTLLARHRKIHLFDVNIKDGISCMESKVISPGNKITVFKTGFCKIGIVVCYDMRFPGLLRAMVDKGIKLAVAPAAFNMTTGPAHWHLITRTRAVDNQIFFAAASPARLKNASYTAYGHSICIDPWGNVLAEASSQEEIIYADIDLDIVGRIRAELPVLKHTRNDIY